tara:strand:+ start:85 stop:207 length:123 start_codon:yes stop_codon:yes gene_type:complete
MKKLLLFFLITLAVFSCGKKNRGELIGIKQKNGSLKNLMG